MKKILILVLTLVSFKTLAQDELAWRANIGAGVALKKNNRANNLYKRNDKKILIAPIPFITAQVGRFSIGGEGLTVKVVGSPLINMSAFVNFGGDKYLGLGMAPRRTSTWVGLSAKFFKYELSAQRDISGNSHGHTIRFSYGEFKKLSDNVMLRAGLSLEWADDRYAEYYYGVRSHEATSTRREYHVKNYFQPGLNIMPIWKISEELAMTTIAGVKLIPKDVRSSPTMNGDKLEMGGLVGISYSLK